MDKVAISNRLIDISNLINNRINFLAILDFNNKVTSYDYSTSIDVIRDNHAKEQVILNNMDNDTLLKVLDYIGENNDDSPEFLRTISLLNNRIGFLGINEDGYEYDDVDPMGLCDTGLSTYKESFITNEVAKRVYLKMPDRIKNVFTDNPRDRGYQNDLLSNFILYKYTLFNIDTKLEYLGSSYSFNINKIPLFDIENNDILSRNICLSIISKMYDIPNVETNKYKVLDNLFDMMCFEYYLDTLDSRYSQVLYDACVFCEKDHENSLYGNIVKTKILAKKN